METNLRVRLARVRRGSHRERRELQHALAEQEVMIRHHHQEVQTSKQSLAFAMPEISRETRTGPTVQTKTLW